MDRRIGQFDDPAFTPDDEGARMEFCLDAGGTNPPGGDNILPSAVTELATRNSLATERVSRFEIAHRMAETRRRPASRESKLEQCNPVGVGERDANLLGSTKLQNYPYSGLSGTVARSLLVASPGNLGLGSRQMRC